MQHTFDIDYNGKQVKVEQVSLDEKNGNIYKISLDGGTLEIKEMKDNDGASRWLEGEKEHETDESKNIGAAIEKYMAE